MRCFVPPSWHSLLSWHHSAIQEDHSCRETTTFILLWGHGKCEIFTFSQDNISLTRKSVHQWFCCPFLKCLEFNLSFRLCGPYSAVLAHNLCATTDAYVQKLPEQRCVHWLRPDSKPLSDQHRHSLLHRDHLSAPERLLPAAMHFPTRCHQSYCNGGHTGGLISRLQNAWAQKSITMVHRAFNQQGKACIWWEAARGRDEPCSGLKSLPQGSCLRDPSPFGPLCPITITGSSKGCRRNSALIISADSDMLAGP